MYKTGTNTGKLKTTSIMPSYTYAGGKVVIHNHEEYRAIMKRNKAIKKFLKQPVNQDRGE